MPSRPETLRQWVIILFTAAGVLLLPWTLWLSASLKPHHETEHWDIAWSGFDSGLAVLFLATAFAAYRRSPWVAALASALGTLLVTDAWFDVVLESHAGEARAVIFALAVELPVAGFCFWIAHRTERFLAQVVEQALHLAPAAERTPEGHLVGVLQVPADGQPAGEPRDADAST